MPFDLFRQTESFWERKRFIQGGGSMRIQIIENQSHLGRRGIFVVQQVLEAVGEISFGSCFFDESVAPASLWLKHQECATCAITRKFGIFARRTTWLCWFGRLEVPNQLAGTLIKTDNGICFVGRLHIQIEEIFHPPDKLSTYLGNTPLFFEPGLKFVFFRTRRMVSSEISST